MAHWGTTETPPKPNWTEALRLMHLYRNINFMLNVEKNLHHWTTIGNAEEKCKKKDGKNHTNYNIGCSRMHIFNIYMSMCVLVLKKINRNMQQTPWKPFTVERCAESSEKNAMKDCQASREEM